MGRQLTNGPIGFVTLKDGTQLLVFMNDALRGYLSNLDDTTVTNIGSIISGQNALVQAQEDAQAVAQAQINAANQAAQAAIASSGTTVTDSATSSSIGVSSDSFVTKLTCDITTTGAGTHTISALLAPPAMTTSAILSGGGPLETFSGAWQIIENPSGTVLFSGTFTITSTLNGGEGGTPFYTHEISFGTALPSESDVASVDTGAVTVELQLKRASGSNTASQLSGSMLVEWA